MTTWVFLTGEYPPQSGGVSDYTHQVAETLANSGDTVHIWAPQIAGEEVPGSVMVHRLPGFDAQSLTVIEAHLEGLTKPIRLVVQYVPHAFGWKGMNLPFCRWLARQPHPLWVIFHEVCVAFRWAQPSHHNLLALVTRIMASIVAKSAKRIYVTTSAWESLLPLGSRCRTLPVPSNCATEVAPLHAAEARNKFVPGSGLLVGHFGTYGKLITPYLRRAIPVLLAADSKRRMLLLGKGGERFAAELIATDPICNGRVFATGPLPSYELACHLAACDLVLQPYPDGVTCRRASLMASMALGLPIVTTTGHLTEKLWKDSDAVVLVPADGGNALADGAESLLLNPFQRERMARKAAELYRLTFALQHTIDALRS